MPVKYFFPMILLVLAFNLTTFGQPKPSIQRETGGSIKTKLSTGIVLNDESSLTREWLSYQDSSIPVKLSGAVGIKTSYSHNRIGGEYQYGAEFSIEAIEPISAIEIRFLLFDIWGKHIRTLGFTEIADIKGVKNVKGTWRLYSENEASEFYASIGYISRVRTMTGRVIEGNTLPVLDEARKFAKKFTSEDLEPKAEKK
jgi:hypothetical protein